MKCGGGLGFHRRSNPCRRVFLLQRGAPGIASVTGPGRQEDPPYEKCGGHRLGPEPDELSHVAGLPPVAPVEGQIDGTPANIKYLVGIGRAPMESATSIASTVREALLRLGSGISTGAQVRPALW